MNITRRNMLALSCAATFDMATSRGARARTSIFSAALFDGFAIFDPRPVFSRAAELVGPEVGRQFVEVWRSRQFEYQWLRALTHRYADFEKAAEDALSFAATQLHVSLPGDLRKQIMQAYRELVAWPDVAPGLVELKRLIPRLGILSNMTPAMLRNGVERSGLSHVLDYVLSTDDVRSYKPDPRAYALGTSTLRLPRENILFVAFASWDAAGARHFGYPTFWLNRQDAVVDELGASPDAAGQEMRHLQEFVRQHQQR